MHGQSTRALTKCERERIEKLNRERLERDLLEQRVVFESGPYEAHVQFSNFCNMSCVMCWDGENPPLHNMSADVLQHLRRDVAQHLSVITPHGGSEPLAVNWDAARGIAEEYSIDLCLTTNVQLLNEKKFAELEDITETLYLSIDSHLPEVFAEIRPGSRPGQVFANLKTAARLANAHGIECIAQVVFMTQNAPTLDATVAFLADAGVQSVNVIQLMDVNGHSSQWDPLLHLPPATVKGIRERCLTVAEAKRVRLGWLDREQHDFREEHTPPAQRKVAYDRWSSRMRRFLPGYCRLAYDRLSITADGEVAPCCYAGSEIEYGTLGEQTFEEIWNGPNARDLRRAMMTWDYPALCKTCRFVDLRPPEPELPFVADSLLSLGAHPRDVVPVLEVIDPRHMTRTEDRPTIRVAQPEQEIGEYFLVAALGGQKEEVHTVSLDQPDCHDGVIELTLAEDVWDRLQTNLGYWWTVVGLRESDQIRCGVRAREIRCLVRHEPLARFEGSTLRYPDAGHLPTADLGGGKWTGSATATVASRPELAAPLRIIPSRRDQKLAQKRATVFPPPELLRRKMGPARYAEMVPEICATANGALPADARVLVVSRGDAQLLQLQGRDARHFPCDDEGRDLGYHPPDGASAMELLDRERIRGAGYLILPASEFWWLAHYREVSNYLLTDTTVVARDDAACMIFELG